MIFELIHALPLSDRRVFNREEAASYLGISPGYFSKLVHEGRLPAPLPSYGRARRWDQVALDQVLDDRSGVRSSAAGKLSAYDQWSNALGQG
jgi:excisionase family DNA binding protein